ncbi:MAG TPA: isochorismatase family cysteine hydrolase [Chloroflexota bacterium]|nr:isochorismatase family cysteine hydrolase [Chloroflexota bacterium]
MARPLADKVDPRQAALVIVDVQNDFCHPDGAAGRRGRDLSQVAGMIEHLTQFLAEARRVGLPVIFIRTEHGPWTDSATWLGRAKTPAEQRIPTCVEGTWGCDFYGVAPQAGERVVVKHRYSAFIGTDLDLILRARGVRTLLIAGIATNVCVESTLRDGFMLDYDIVLLADCCAAYSREEHEATLRNVANYFGEVARAADVAALWATAAAPAAP